MQENREGKNEGNLGRKQDSVVDPWGGGDGPGADVIICPLRGQLSSVKRPHKLRHIRTDDWAKVDPVCQKGKAISRAVLDTLEMRSGNFQQANALPNAMASELFSLAD